MSDGEPFEVIEIWGEREGPDLLIVAGVHGDEYEGIEAVRELAPILESRLKHLAGSITLIPIANRGAFALAARCAADGKDLARTCPGRPDGGYTERIAHALSRRIREADFFIDLHTGGSVMQVWPLAGYGLVFDRAVLNTQRKMARAFGLPLVWGTSAEFEGRTLSVARDAGVPAIYAEYLGGGKCSRRGVETYVEGCLNVMRALEILTDLSKPVLLGEDHCIEDRSPDSGHMQVCHLCPIEGYFQAAVQLGEAIEAGDSLGEVVPVGGGKPVSVDAEKSGRIIVLRTCCSVQDGHALAVILEDPPPAAFADYPIYK